MVLHLKEFDSSCRFTFSRQHSRTLGTCFKCFFANIISTITDMHANTHRPFQSCSANSSTRRYGGNRTPEGTTGNVESNYFYHGWIVPSARQHAHNESWAPKTHIGGCCCKDAQCNDPLRRHGVSTSIFCSTRCFRNDSLAALWTCFLQTTPKSTSLRCCFPQLATQQYKHELERASHPLPG